MSDATSTIDKIKQSPRIVKATPSYQGTDLAKGLIYILVASSWKYSHPKNFFFCLGFPSKFMTTQ